MLDKYTSTGSSKVVMFMLFELSSFRIVYRVVDFPEPVGPLTTTRPVFKLIIFLIRLICSSSKPKSSNL